MAFRFLAHISLKNGSNFILGASLEPQITQLQDPCSKKIISYVKSHANSQLPTLDSIFLVFLDKFNWALKISKKELSKSVGTICSFFCGLQSEGIRQVPRFFWFLAKFTKWFYSKWPGIWTLVKNEILQEWETFLWLENPMASKAIQLQWCMPIFASIRCIWDWGGFFVIESFLKNGVL